VIGGLMVVTVATLFFVPVVFSMIYRRLEARGRGARGAATPQEH